jgi:hypothetical protein
MQSGAEHVRAKATEASCGGCAKQKKTPFGSWMSRTATSAEHMADEVAAGAVAAPAPAALVIPEREDAPIVDLVLRELVVQLATALSDKLAALPYSSVDRFPIAGVKFNKEVPSHSHFPLLTHPCVTA